MKRPARHKDTDIGLAFLFYIAGLICALWFIVGWITEGRPNFETLRYAVFSMVSWFYIKKYVLSQRYIDALESSWNYRWTQ